MKDSVPAAGLINMYKLYDAVIKGACTEGANPDAIRVLSSFENRKIGK